MDVHLRVLLTARAHCDQAEQDFPGTSGCEFKDYHSTVNTTNEWRDFSQLFMWNRIDYWYLKLT